MLEPAPIGDIVNMVVKRGEQALSTYRSLFKRFSTWYDMYRGFYTEKRDAYRNFLHIPVMLSIIQSDVARKVQTSFGAWPIIEFAGYTPETAATAKRNEIVVSAQMKDAESFAKAVDFYLASDLYGTAVGRVGWKRTTKRLKRRDIDELTGNERVVAGDVTLFNGPDWDVIDPQDWWPQPGKRRDRDVKWGIHRYYLDLDDIRGYVASGIFLQSGLTALEAADAPSSIVDEASTRLSAYRSWYDYNARMNDPFSKPVEIWEFVGEVPQEFAKEGFSLRIVTVANRRVLLRDDPFPFWHGNLQQMLRSYSPMPDPDHYHGTGKMEVGERMQAGIDKLASLKLDSLEMFAVPMFLYNKSQTVDLQRLTTKPGAMFGIDGPVDDSQIRPLIPDLRGVQSLYPEIASLDGFAQKGTGIAEDTVQGMPGAGRQTAREFLGRQEAVLTRLMLEARLAEEGFVEPLGNAFRDLNKQYLKTPHTRNILGSAAITNPITGLPYPQEPTTLSLADINHDYQAQAVGASQMLGRSIKQQNAIALLQATSAHPVGMQMVNWAAFFRQLFDLFDMKNVDDLLVKNVPAINQAAQEQGQVPSSPQDLMSGGGVSELTQLDPMLLGAQGTAPMPALS